MVKFTHIARSSNGRIHDSESWNLGPIPSLAAIKWRGAKLIHPSGGIFYVVWLPAVGGMGLL